MLLLDENKAKWIVLKGDPGYWAVSTLARAGFDKIILPRQMYMTGLRRTIEGMGCDDKSLQALMDADEYETFLYLMWMRDCMLVLDTAAQIEYTGKRRQQDLDDNEEEAKANA